MHAHGVTGWLILEGKKGGQQVSGQAQCHSRDLRGTLARQGGREREGWTAGLGWAGHRLSVVVIGCWLWSSGSGTFCFVSICLPFAESLGPAPLSFHV